MICTRLYRWQVAAKASAAAEAAADAAGASKVKRQVAEKKARELWATAAKAEAVQKEAEVHLASAADQC